MANDPRFEVYPQHEGIEDAGGTHEGEVGQFYWRFRAGNGQISAVGGEGFTRREDAHRAVRVFCATVTDISILVDTAGLVAAGIPIIDVED